MENSREVLKIVVVGHVDHGKSTLIGRLLHDTKSIPEGAIERVKRISKEKGKPFEYAYLLDAFEEEQKQGITIDTTQLQFHTEKRDYVIIDAPGHKEFLKNMISGAANAEAALLIIDANEGIQEQSKRHGYILSLLGIQKVYVIVNKMDLIDYSEEKFNQIKSNMNSYLNSLNVYPSKYIPVSAFLGENIVEKSAQMPWYKREPVLLAIDLFEKDKDMENKPLRFPIQDVYKFDNRRIIAGRIESGSLRIGDELSIFPSDKTTRVKTIEYWTERDKKDEVTFGMSVGITVEDEFFNKRGEVITLKSDEAPLVGNLFRANIFWMGKSGLSKNKKYKLKLVTQEVECEISAINRVIDAATLETLEGAGEVRTNDVAEVIIRTKEPVSFDAFKNNRITGRFVIVDGYDVSGGGIISGVESFSQITGKFVKNDLSLPVLCFDEYYLSLPEYAIKTVSSKPGIYNIDEAVPLEGETYKYPGDFDMIDLQAGLAVKIRDSRLYDLLSLEKYEYGNLPVLDIRGAEVKISSGEDLEKYKNDSERQGAGIASVQASFANKWHDFFAYRKIKYTDKQKWDTVEYII